MSQPMRNATPAGEGFQAQTLNRLFAPALIGFGGPACNFLRKRFTDRLGFSVYIWSIWIAIMVQSG